MEIDQLETFLTLLQAGSFSRAAQTLKIGQSTVSFHIKALEQALGTRLLDRRGGRIRVTPAGSILRRYAKRILSLRAEASAQLRAEESGEAGHLTIAASTIPAEYLLPKVIAKFGRSHPGVSVTLDVSDSAKALRALLAEECDLALVGAQVRDGRLAYVRFAEDQVVLVAPGAGSSGMPARLSVRELARMPLVVREEGSGTHSAVAPFLARYGRSNQRLGLIRVGSTQAVKQCVLEGAGAGFVSQRAVAEDLKSGRLRLVQAPGLPVRRRFYAARLRNVTLPTAGRAFLNLLIQEYR